MSKFICKICGKEEDSSEYINGNDLQNESLCFECHFWKTKNDMKINKYRIINDKHCHYFGELINKDECTLNNGFGLGFGGIDFYVKFNDGQIKWFNNVTCQGNIPDILIGRDGYENIKENAVFIHQYEYIDYMQNELKKLPNGTKIMFFDSLGRPKECTYNNEKVYTTDGELYFDPFKDNNFKFKTFITDDNGVKHEENRFNNFYFEIL